MHIVTEVKSEIAPATEFIIPIQNKEKGNIPDLSQADELSKVVLESILTNNL